ncbi:MAG: DUF2225 domain-containing protein [Alistipes sp.]|nr:DUF2225 domain-containing protein [Alistipes sp.]
MANLLSGLSRFGIKAENFQNIYEDGEDKNKDKEEKKAEPLKEADFIFDKTMTCPVCGKQFKTKTVRVGKAKLVGTDTDLKPIYAGFEPLKYDVIVCSHCGYAATSKSYGHITPGQAKLIREGISVSFKEIPDDENNIYTFYDAIDRHSLALANVICMKGKNSEKAYICLKMAWLYRSMVAGLSADDQTVAKLRKDCQEEEQKYLQSAYEGFSLSYTKEVPPICGMDINTVTLLLADLARKCGDKTASRRYIEAILISKDANSRMKEKAREIKELLEQN